MSELAPRNTGTEVDTFLQSWEQRKELANTLLRSGFLPQAFKTPEQVIAVMLKGQELGIPVMEALNGINVVNGKPTVSPQLMLALVRRSRELEDIKIEHTDDSCVITIKRKGQSPHTTRFGVTEARALSLLGKENYRKQPHTMFQWRALAANLRITFPDVIGGLYTPEEMGAEVQLTEDGNQIFAQTDLSDEIADSELNEGEEQASARSAEETDIGTFAPDKETITFGKYAGVMWSEVPENYLQWLKANATRRDILSKVEATLERRGAPKQRTDDAASSVADELFPPPPTAGATGGDETASRTAASSGRGAEPPSERFGELSASLREMAGGSNVDALKEWASRHMGEIESLSDDERAALRRAYRNALDLLRERQTNESGGSSE